MSEVRENPSQEEIKTESPIVKSVKDAMGNALEKTKETNREYWEIRKALQERLDWHGGGIYKMYVENMDKVTNVVWGRGDRGLGSRIMEVKDRVTTRLGGAFLASTSASADLLYNAATWPVRWFLPIPKDVFKRFAIAEIYHMTIANAIGGGALAASGAVLGLEPALIRGTRTVGEAAITAPEVAATMVKRRAEKALYNILHPKPKIDAPIK